MVFNWSKNFRAPSGQYTIKYIWGMILALCKDTKGESKLLRLRLVCYTRCSC